MAKYKASVPELHGMQWDEPVYVVNVSTNSGECPTNDELINTLSKHW